MKFVDIKGESFIREISIEPPKLNPFYKYYYPDGKTLGVFKRKTYFVGYNGPFTRISKEYYFTPQEALQGDKHLLVRDGKIWYKGKVTTTLKDGRSYFFLYESDEEPKEYLRTLEERWGINLGGMISLEAPKILSLYEYKESTLSRT